MYMIYYTVKSPSIEVCGDKDFFRLILIKKFPIYDHLYPSYQSQLVAIYGLQEPTTYSKAIKDQRQVDAMKSEIQALEDNMTWSVTSLPAGKKAIGCMWIYKI